MNQIYRNIEFFSLILLIDNFNFEVGNANL